MKAKKRNWLIALVRDINRKYLLDNLVVNFFFVEEEAILVSDWKKCKTTLYSQRQGEEPCPISDRWKDEVMYDPGLVKAEKRLLELLKGVR